MGVALALAAIYLGAARAPASEESNSLPNRYRRREPVAGESNDE